MVLVAVGSRVVMHSQTSSTVCGLFLDWPQFVSVLTLSLTSLCRAFHRLLNVTHNYTLLATIC